MSRIIASIRAKSAARKHAKETDRETAYRAEIKDLVNKGDLIKKIYITVDHSDKNAQMKRKVLRDLERDGVFKILETTKTWDNSDQYMVRRATAPGNLALALKSMGMAPDTAKNISRNFSARHVLAGGRKRKSKRRSTRRRSPRTRR